MPRAAVPAVSGPDIIRDLPDPTFVIDKNGVVIAWNRAMEEFTGVPASDMIGRGDYEYALPFYGERRPILIDLALESRGPVASNYNHFRSEGRIITATTKGAHPGGRNVVLWGKASPLVDGNDTIVGAIETIRDVTVQLQMEEQIRASEERLRTLLHSTSDIIQVIGRDGKIVFDTNASGLKLGYPAGFAIGKDPFAFIFPEDRGRLQQELATVFGKRSPGLPVEFRLLKADGSPAWAESTMKNLFGVPGIDGIVVTTRLIEDRKLAEQAIRKSEERYRNIFENAVIGIFQSTPDGKFLNVNRAMARMFGYADPGTMTREIADIGSQLYVHPPDRDAMIAVLEGQESSGPAETRFFHRDGHWFWASVQVRVVRNDDSSVAYYEGTMVDITDRKKAEDALKESEARYSALFDNNYSVSLLIDPDTGRIVDVNSAAIRYYGYSRDRLTGMGIYDLNRLQKDTVVDNLKKAKNEQSKHFSSIHFLSDGSRRNVEIYSGPITVNGKPLFYSIIHDITDRKRAEAALRESEARYRTLIDQIPDYVIVHRDGILLYVNPAAARDLGYNGSELIGRALTEFVTAEYHETIRASTDTRLAGATVEPYEVDIRAKDGTQRTVLINGAQVIFDGKPAVLNVLTDITIRKAAEDFMKRAKEELEDRVGERTWELTQANEQLAEEIRARNKAEKLITQSLEEKDLLLREIHHRVKNNLQIISSLLNLQSRSISDTRVLESIRDSQNRVRAMALVHERMYRSHEIAAIDIGEYIRYLTNQIFRFYNISQTQVEAVVTVDHIMTDIDTAIPLGLIINELVSNALKHAFPEGRHGTIRIEGALLDDGRIRIVFRDNGVGMPSGIDWETTNSLGLRLVKSLTEQLMGMVTMEQNGGTVFTVTVRPRTPVRGNEQDGPDG